MQTTVGKILRDSNLQDTENGNTLIRLSLINNDSKIEISVIKDGVLSAISIPFTLQGSYELMTMGYKLVDKFIQDDLGKIIKMPG